MTEYVGVFPSGYEEYIKATSIDSANDAFRHLFGEWPDLVEEVRHD